MKGGFCIKYIKFSTSRVTRRAFGATNNKIINELCRANWSVVTLARLRDLQIRQRWSEGAFSIIYVEISVHELCTVWRRSKLKNKIWHSGHNRHIALLKRTQKQVKMGYSVSIYKTLWNNSCSFSRDLVHGTRKERTHAHKTTAHGTQWTSPPMNHNDKTRHFLAAIKINWTNPAWHIGWRDCANFSLCYTTCFAGSTSLNQN